MASHKILGKQYLMEFHGCDLAAISHIERFQQIAMDAANESNATVVHSFFHQFQPQGVSGVLVISESHFAYHTWPEHGYVAADLFTCSEDINVTKAFEVLTKEFGCTRSHLTVGIPRGHISQDGHIVDTPFSPRIEELAKTASMNWQDIYESKDAWGILASIDIHDCDPELIRSKEYIERFAKHLCDLIEMKRFGDTVVVNFGEDERVAGFSMTQLIETSLVSGHFANQTNSVYLDIFSCKYFDPEKAAGFCLEAFEGKDYSLQVSLRK